MIINRYTQAPAPLRLNPLSFEELSRVPLAKAQAKGEGIAAIGRINTQYNVDDKDLNYITDLVSKVDQSKSAIVDDIASNGVNSQTVSSVLQLKKQRDNLYQTKINQAEENKKRLDLWKQQLDEMTMRGVHSSKWADLVKNKEYQNWQGTFGDNSDIPTTFVPTFGPKYIDIDRYIKETFNQAKEMSVIPEKTKSWGGGKPTIETDKNTGATFMVTPGGGRVKEMTNESKIESAKQLILQQMSDPTTELGQFVQYGGSTFEDVEGALEKYKQLYLQNDKNSDIEGSKYSQVDNSNNTIPPGYNAQEYKQQLFQVIDKVKNMSVGQAANVYDAGNTASKAVTNLSTAEKLIPFYVGIVGIKTFVSRLFDLSEGSEKDQVDVINNFDNVADQLVKEGSFNSTMLYNAKHLKGKTGDKYRQVVLNSMKNYIDDNLAPIVQPELSTVDYLTTTFGKKNEKVDPEKAAQDILYGAPNWLTMDKKEYLDPSDKEQEDLEKSISLGRVPVQGVMPMFSPDLLDANGNYIENMSSALAVMNANTESKNYKKKYYTPLPDNLRATPNWKRIERVNKKITPLKVGQEVPMFLKTNEVGKPEFVTVKHEFSTNPKTGKLVPGNYFMYRYDEKGKKKISKELLNGSRWETVLEDPDVLMNE
jgi:hypothetical protein